MTAVTLALVQTGCVHGSIRTTDASPAPATTVRAEALAPTAAPRAAIAPGKRSTSTAVAPGARAGSAATRPTSVRGATPSPVPEPTIYSVLASPSVVHGGQAVNWDVRTTPDVVRVSAHVAAVTLQMQRLSAGHFGLSFAVPNGVPWFFHGTYNLDVQALTAGGLTLHHGITLTFE